jgi:hypothetical protein
MPSWMMLAEFKPAAHVLKGSGCSFPPVSLTMLANGAFNRLKQCRHGMMLYYELKKVKP